MNFAASIFNTSSQANLNLSRIYNKAFAHYFRDVLLQQWNPGQKILIDNMEVHPFAHKTLVHQNDLRDFNMDKEHREALAKPIENEMISSMRTFLQEII